MCTIHEGSALLLPALWSHAVVSGTDGADVVRFAEAAASFKAALDQAELGDRGMVLELLHQLWLMEVRTTILGTIFHKPLAEEVLERHRP